MTTAGFSGQLKFDVFYDSSSNLFISVINNKNRKCMIQDSPNFQPSEMFLEYEKELLLNVNQDACLVILPKGLGYTEIVLTLLKAYTNERSLALLLNTNEQEKEYFLKHCLPCFYDVTGLTVSQRSERYKMGGVFYGSVTLITTDFVNRNIAIEKISTLIILNAESIEQDSALAFISYLFREHNSPGLIKAFSSDVIRINNNGLEATARSLCLNKILFYPRFHEVIKTSLTVLPANQVYLKQSGHMEEAVLLIEDLMKKIYSCGKMEMGAFDYCKLLIYKQNNEDIIAYKKLTALLFNVNSLATFLYFEAMIELQRRNKSSSSWIFDNSSHALRDVLKKMVVAEIEKAKIDPTEFIFDTVSCSFRPDLVIDSVKRVKTVMGDETPKPAETQENSNSVEIIEQENIDDKNDGVVLSEVLESKALSKFYLVNSKIRQMIQILNLDRGIKTAILVQNGTVKRTIDQTLTSLSLLDGVATYTHGQFLYLDEYDYDRIILLNPDLQSIRNIEYISARWCQPAVYILQYKNSIEEQRFLEELREEKHAFETIIKDRAALPLKIELEKIELEDESLDRKFKIVVDSREMRSKLPFFLYKANNILEIKVMDIGDYFLGTDKCIERKSIDDFLSSLTSGRLYQQIQRLTHAYANPLLLLEFDGGNPVIGDFDNIDTFRNSYIARFCFFLFNFPNVQIIWSNSHINTVRIIRDIQNKEFVDQQNDLEYDPELLETLLCIPGVNRFNLDRIVDEFSNLYDLSRCEKERLERILDTATASKIYNFFRNQLH